MYYRIRNTATDTTKIRHAPSVPPIAAGVKLYAESTYSFMIPDIKNNVCKSVKHVLMNHFQYACRLYINRCKDSVGRAV